jgi:hypothetical protein
MKGINCFKFEFAQKLKWATIERGKNPNPQPISPSILYTFVPKIEVGRN